MGHNEVTAIVAHERAHLRARHDLVLEAFTAVHDAFPVIVRSKSALDAVKLLVELLADDAAVRTAGPTPLARALVACAGGPTPVGAMAAGGPTTLIRVRRLGEVETTCCCRAAPTPRPPQSWWCPRWPSSSRGSPNFSASSASDPPVGAPRSRAESDCARIGDEAPLCGSAPRLAR